MINDPELDLHVNFLRFALFVLPFLLCSSVPGQEMGEAVEIAVAYPDLTFQRPVDFTVPNTDGTHVVVLEQPGRMFAFPNKSSVSPDEKHLLLDMTDRVHGGEEGESGLLGVAFHPAFPEKKQVFFNYTTRIRGQLQSVISAFSYDPDRGKMDPNSERRILTVKQPGGVHNAGCLMFGPDGYLYSSIGQGGTKEGNAQDPSNLLGTIIRIDVNDGAGNRPYRIPEDNPFVNNPGVRDEIYALGFRNPWRFSFHPENNTIWLGESDNEINLVRKGDNHGYPAKRLGRMRDNNVDPPVRPLEEPVLLRDNTPREKIPHIPVGGYFYRGNRIPRLKGAYVYGDFTQNDIWGLRFDFQTESVTSVQKLGTVPHPTAFGQDRNHELYVCSFGPERRNRKNGTIYKLVPPD